MKVGISNDHSAVELKNSVMSHLKEKGYEVVNYGTDSTESYNYPLAGSVLAQASASPSPATSTKASEPAAVRKQLPPD